MKIKLLSALLFTGLFFGACSEKAFQDAPLRTAAVTTKVVTESDVDPAPVAGTDWYRFERGTGDGVFITGPANPPLGSGSFRLSTPDTNAKVYLFSYDHVGTPLTDLSAMSYSSYRNPKSTALELQLPALNLEIDFNGDAAGGYAVLVFEPYYTYGGAAIQEGVWQGWDAYRGGEAVWWSSRAINGVCAFSCFVPWSDIVAANPDATVLGGYGVNAGGGNAGLIASTDALSIQTGTDSVTYDFEEFRVPASSDDCKNGGWRTLTRPDGSAFKNQGQCIQYANTGR